MTPPPEANSILLVLPVPVVAARGSFFIEHQAANGLRLWMENFDHVTACCPLRAAGPPDENMADLAPLIATGRLTMEVLPDTRSLVGSALALPATAKRLDRLIAGSRYLQFLIGGFAGDWGALAAIIAHRRGRRAAIWADRVESEVIAFGAAQSRGKRRAYRLLLAWLTRTLERHVVRRAPLGLFHGMDTYAAYAPISPNPQLVHDIHLGPEMRIAPANLTAKQTAVRAGGPLSIAYSGRVHPDKGVADWIDALALAQAKGVDFSATWHGDGPLLDEARATIERLGLGDRVHFAGWQPHAAAIAAIRAADIFLFCHKTPESPRCLIEALLSGTPIVGHDSPFPRDLIPHGGGVLTPQDPAALAEAIVALDRDRERLATMMGSAAADGYPIVDVEVFRHRAELIRAMGG